MKIVFAIALVAMMTAAAFSGCVGKTPGDKDTVNIYPISTDDINALKSITAARISTPAEGTVVLASDADPFYALIATPVAAYYEGGVLKSLPLLVTNEGNTYPWIHDTPIIPNEPTVYTDIGPVVKFIETYNPSGAVMVGMDKFSAVGTTSRNGQASAVSYTLSATQSFVGDVTEVALKIAETYWSSADAVMLVDIETGYADAVSAGVLASYLNMPVIPVAGEPSGAVADAIAKLGAKYTLVCGEVEVSANVASDLGKLLGIEGAMEIAKTVLSLMPGGNVASGAIPYVVMANPLDTVEPTVLEETVVSGLKGELTDAGTSVPYPGTPEAGTTVPFEFEIPAGYNYANLVIDIKFDLTGLTTGPTPINADILNTRGLMWGYRIEDDGSAIMIFMANAVCYDYVRDENGVPTHVWLFAEFQVMNHPGKYRLEVGPLAGASPGGVLPGTVPFDATVNIQKLDIPTYPLMPGLSSLAPYLAAVRGGVVLANPDFALQVAGLGGCVECGDAAADADAMYEANMKTASVHGEFVKLLKEIYGISDAQQLNDKLHEDLSKAPYLAILADTNMVPMYYYEGSVGEGVGGGGEGIPGDLLYSTVNPDLREVADDANSALHDINGNAMSAEVAVSRLTGYDAQDASALIARSVFYDRYLAGYKGPLNQAAGNQPGNGFGATTWTGIGSMVPVEAAAPTMFALDAAFTRAGFNTLAAAKAEASGRSNTAIQWQSSNFIWMCVHGFWYHFVPDSVLAAAMLPTSPYAVKHVKYMPMGPSIIFLESCITGRIDGLKPYNTISQAFMHSGINTYIGGTRSMLGLSLISDGQLDGVGEYFSKVFYGHLAGYIASNNNPDDVASLSPSDISVGHAMIYARNAYIELTGISGDGAICTITAVAMYADPAFNPYEPNHEGGLPMP